MCLNVDFHDKGITLLFFKKTLDRYSQFNMHKVTIRVVGNNLYQEHYYDNFLNSLTFLNDFTIDNVRFLYHSNII